MSNIVSIFPDEGTLSASVRHYELWVNLFQAITDIA